MCVAVPARVLSITADEAEIDLGGVRRRISIALTPEVQLGQYVLVHTGFAIAVMDEQEAHETLQLFAELGVSVDPRALQPPEDTPEPGTRPG